MNSIFYINLSSTSNVKYHINNPHMFENGNKDSEYDLEDMFYNIQK